MTCLNILDRQATKLRRQQTMNRIGAQIIVEGDRAINYPDIEQEWKHNPAIMFQWADKQNSPNKGHQIKLDTKFQKARYRPRTRYAQDKIDTKKAKQEHLNEEYKTHRA